MKTHSFSVDKGRTLNQSALPDVKDPRSTAVFVFASPNYFDKPEFFEALAGKYPGAVITGCSTAGEIFQDRVHDETATVAIAEFESTRLAVASAVITSPDTSYDIGKELGLQLLDNGLAGVFLLLDGISANATGLLDGLNSVLPKGVAVTGGIAGDRTDFEKAWVLKDGKPTVGAATVMGFYGSAVCFEHGIRGGWTAFGPERRVTRSRDNVVYEFDGQPALALYKKYLGDKAADLPASGLSFPLRIRANGGQEQYMRCIQDIDEQQQSITCGGNVPQGSTAQLMRASFDQLIDTPSDHAVQSRSKDAALALTVSCVGRRQVLGQRIDEETEASLEKLPPGTHQVGFYAYGEIAPASEEGAGQLHNQTMTITVIQEKAGSGA